MNDDHKGLWDMLDNKAYIHDIHINEQHMMCFQR